MSVEQFSKAPQPDSETKNPWDFGGFQDEEASDAAIESDKNEWDFTSDADVLEGDSLGVKSVIEQYSDVSDDTMNFAVPEAEKQGHVVKQWSPDETYAKTMRAALGADYAIDVSRGPGSFDTETYLGADVENSIKDRVDSLTTVPESDKFNLKLALINEAVAKKAQGEALKEKAERESGTDTIRTSRARKASRKVLAKLMRR